MADAADVAKADAKPRHWVWRVMPYAIAVGAISAILWKYPPSRIAAEMQSGDTLAMAPFAALLVFTGILLVAWSDHTILQGALDRAPPFWIVARARVAVSLLGMVGYAAGVGGFGVWVARATGCGAKLASGCVLYKLSADFTAVCIVTTGAVYLGDPHVAQSLRIIAPTIAGVLMALKLLSRYGPVPIERLPVIFHPWRTISQLDALKAVGLRTMNIVWITVCVWLGANAFGMSVPLTAMATYFPIVLVVGSMPVNVGGFGAVQGAWLLLEPWATGGEQVIAFSALWQLVIGVCVAVRGAPFMRAVTREIESVETK